MTLSLVWVDVFLCIDKHMLCVYTCLCRVYISVFIYIYICALYVYIYIYAVYIYHCISTCLQYLQ